MSARLTLVSHALCPYVQRAAIVLVEKGIEFERQEIDLANKPAWFVEISPLGKTPVLLVDGEAIFESAVICEFLDETEGARLHPELPLLRARHRAWMEFGSSLLNTIAAFYNAADDVALDARTRDIRHRFEQLEATLGEGPYFAGDRFSMVDAAFGPVFRYFDVFETLGIVDFFGGLPKLAAWRVRLAARRSVRDAAHDNYHALLRVFLCNRGSALSRYLAGGESASEPVDTPVREEGRYAGPSLFLQSEWCLGRPGDSRFASLGRESTHALQVRWQNSPSGATDARGTSDEPSSLHPHRPVRVT